MRFSKASAATVLAASVPLSFAQTFTSCDPTKKDCPADVGLPKSHFESDFTKGNNPSWSTAAYSSLKYGKQGAEFIITAAKQAPTINTDFYVFFGRIDVKMKAAKGTGIVSSIVFQSDDLDEIDWEILGGNTTTVETNFFGKGNTTTYDRAIYYPVSNPQEEFHTYTIDWNSDRIKWIIDGKTVRTLPYDDPTAVYGKNYPQTPMQIKLGNWCGGCKGEPQGTIEWAGGKTTFKDAPYTMYVESVVIQNANPAEKYEWSNKSGSWKSIKIVNKGKKSSPKGKATGKQAAVAGAKAPTKDVVVKKIHNTAAVTQLSKALTGKPYPTNWPGNSTGGHGSGSGHHTGGLGGHGSHGGGVATSTVVATTKVGGGSPSGSPGASGSPGSGNGAGASSSGKPNTPSTGAASSNVVMLSTSILGFLFSFLFL